MRRFISGLVIGATSVALIMGAITHDTNHDDGRIAQMVATQERESARYHDAMVAWCDDYVNVFHLERPSACP